MQDGELRDATPAEIAEIEARKGPAAIVVPDRIPMLNAHLELVDAGWMPQIVAFIESMPEHDSALARVYWDKALTMERGHPLVLAIPAAIGKTEAEVDELFIRAAARPV
jgi:chloramphenicol 3-O-phosphotransferase